jgi:murein DD-endopeptidase MepM/ murein hydrolase activator NlpD
MRWSRRGLTRCAGLAFVCFITVVAKAPASAWDSGSPSGGQVTGFPEWRLPLEDRPQPQPPLVDPELNPDLILELCPVDWPHHYIDDFGAPRRAGGFHRHQGIDIMAPGGTPIRAPFDGRAEVSNSWAGGLGVYVHGERGFAFNAHLMRLGKLGKVQAGDVIGYVGNSGDARGRSTHDHFEWHPGGGRAVDSFSLLNAVCRVPPRRTPALPATPPRARRFV